MEINEPESSAMRQADWFPGVWYRVRAIFVVALGMAGSMLVTYPATAASPAAVAVAGPPALKVAISKIDRNVLDDRTPDMAGIKYGLEGGEVLRDAGGILHLFTSEQFGDPYWVASCIAHWTSEDGLSWHRDGR